MTRVSALAFAALFGAAALAPAQSRVIRLPKAPPAKNVKAQRVWARMATLKISLDFDDTPVLEIMKFLRQTSGINMVVDGELRNGGDLDERRISLQVSDIAFRSALNLVLDFTDLCARWRHGVLLITSPDKARGATTLRIYDVRDITFKLTDFPGPKIELASGSGMDDGGGGLAFGDDDEDSAPPSTDEIVETVKSAIGDAADAEGTMMSVLGGLMVVRQSPEVHREILEVLHMLRSTR